MTAVEWLVEQLLNGKLLMPSLIEQAEAMDEKNIKDAIIYALDEDGHTGDWKLKFANDYYEKLKKEDK